MISLLRKELNTFFGSITGYLVIGIFLLTTSLFLWVIPGNFNIIEGQRSTLKQFFEIAPWLYLFLIPAITMRMFADEKRMGTIELLVTRPIKSYGIVGAKFLSAMLLVTISLIPTLLYFFSVYHLGNPIGNIDTGATWGSFIGLLFLASVYVAIGLLASSITSNQVISFLIAIVFSYIFFLGFDFISELPVPIAIQNILLLSGINNHYQSISRGVIDSRDLCYFLLITALILWFTRNSILRRKFLAQVTLRNALVLGTILISVYSFSSIRLFRLDLTAEKRYSVTSISKEIIRKQVVPISIEVYLTGDLPAGMKEFQQAIIEKIEDFNAYSPQRIEYKIIDVYKITSVKERDKYIEGLINSGIQPVNFGHKTNEGLSTKQIFPGVIFISKEKGVALNLLKNNPLLGADENLKNSIELLEYEFAAAFKTLQQQKKPTIAFLQGQGEADNNETGDVRYRLGENYNITNKHSNELLNGETVSVLVIADPSQHFAEKDKLFIDQYLMNGGKILWCVDPVFTSIDSLSKGMTTLSFDRDLNIRDQLFTYGVRLNADVLQDAVCMEYPINTAPMGQPTNFVPAPFYYSPLATPNPLHAVSRNLNNVLVEFASSLEPVGENGSISKTVILATSPYGRSIQTPVEVSLMSATNPPDQKLFNQPNIPIGVILEGDFNSAFSNRITSSYGISAFQLKLKSSKTKMIVVADGGILKNKVRNHNGQIQLQPMGYDQYSGQTFGNRDFIVNCIDFLADDMGIMELRSKAIKLRMLDKVKIREEKIKWQLINTIMPLILFAFFGIFFSIMRKRKFSR